MKHDAFRRTMENPETNFYLFSPDKLRQSIPMFFLRLLVIIILQTVSIHNVMAQAPTATTDAATGIGSNGATVNGTVNPNGDPTTVFFEYGLTVEYGSTMASLQSPITGSTDTPVSANLSLLDPLTTYHYRVGAINVSGTTYGADMTFTTLVSSGSPPLVMTEPASGTGADFATLNGQVYTFNINTTVIFHWGTDTSYGNSITADQSPVTSSTFVPVTAILSGLADNTTYHYRITASNLNGTAYGQDMTFAIGTGGTAPTATTNAVIGVTSQAATLKGTVNANGDATAVSFEYGTDTNYGYMAPAEPSTVSGSTDTAVSLDINNFSPSTTYHYRVVAINGYGTAHGADMTFTTQPSPPTATTEAVSSVTSSSAVLNGTVNANGANTVVTFEYGLDTGYGTAVTADQSPVTGSVDTAVGKMISGLTNGVTYHYRVVAVNSGGTTYGADMTFTAGAAAATAITSAASTISNSSAVLNGTVNANGNSTTVLFEYGTTTAYDRSTFAAQNPISGTSDTAVNATISDLLPNTTYHYRVTAINAGGSSHGADMTFTTFSAPSVTTNGATSVTTSGATMNGTVNANGSSSTVTLEFGTTTAYGTTVTADQSPVTGTTDTPVSKAITGLTIDTTYHYKVVATNGYGTTNGADMTFTTSAPSAPIVTTDAADKIMQDGATLNGTVNAANDDTTVTFEYGTDTGYGNTVTADQSPVTGSADTPASKKITGLALNTLYHYRVIGTNGYGTTYGADMTFTTSSFPIVFTQPATAVGATSATLNGIANANYDSSTMVAFQYDSIPPASFYTYSAVADPGTINGGADVPVTCELTGLLPDTTYYYRVYAGNSMAQYSYGEQMTFTTLPTTDSAPTAVTDSATSVGSTTATMNGTVNANNSSTTVTFEYGLDTNYGKTATAAESPVAGNTDTPVSSDLTSLSPNTTYHYRVKAQNTGNTTYGADMTFTTTPSPPTADTDGATGVTSTGATLNGTANANNDSTTVTFEYGPTTSYGSTETADQSPVTGSSDTAVSKAVTGLTNNTTYHYRVVAQNSAGTTYGADLAFFTGVTAPLVTTVGATDIGYTTATLNGMVNANNGSTKVSFEYGKTTNYDRISIADQSPVTGSSAIMVSTTLTNLLPDTTYHFRVTGTNEGGTNNGEDIVFTTQGIAPKFNWATFLQFILNVGHTRNKEETIAR